MMYVSSSISPCVVSFLFLYKCFFMYAILIFCFTQDALMSFVLSVSKRQVVKVYQAMNSLFAKFFKSLC